MALLLAMPALAATPAARGECAAGWTCRPGEGRMDQPGASITFRFVGPSD